MNALPALATVFPAVATRLRIPIRLDPATGVALTFDDGPHPDGTAAILELLDAAQLKATFFLIGEQVVKRPALAAEIGARGHVVALHGHRHRTMLRLNARQIKDDLARGTAAIEDATGRSPRLHRPPYGIYTATGLRAARTAGLAPLLWSKWGKDWRKFTTAERIARRATRTLTPGDVILLHDADFYSAKRSHERTVDALPLIIGELERAGHATVLPV